MIHDNITRYGLNAERVEYYRCVRACVPSLDHEEIKRKLTSLKLLAEAIDKQVDEFNKLMGELVDLDVAQASTVVEYFIWGAGDPAWTEPRQPIYKKASFEEWTERPTTPQGLDAWNRFLVALQQQPIRIYRTSYKIDNQWEAEFRRADGSAMFVSLQDLREHRKREGFNDNRESLLTIVNEMEKRVDESVAKHEAKA